MKAVTWQGRRDIRVDDVPDPRILEDDDIIVEITSSGLCGSDLHLSAGHRVISVDREPERLARVRQRGAETSHSGPGTPPR